MVKVQLNQTKNKIVTINKTVEKVIVVEETVNEINITLSIEEAAYLAVLTGATKGGDTKFNFSQLYCNLSYALGTKNLILNKAYNSIDLKDHFPDITLNDINFDKSLLNPKGT